MTRWALRTHDDDGSEMWWGGTRRMWVRSPLEAEVFSDFLVETDLAQPMDRRACGPTSEWVDLDERRLQPVEAAKPVRMWVMRRGDGFYWSGTSGGEDVWLPELSRAHRSFHRWFTTDDREFVPVSVGSDGTVTEEMTDGEIVFEETRAMRSRANAACIAGAEEDERLRRLDEPAPAIDQPSPYSDTDAPIPYRPRRSAYVAAALPQKAHASRFARQLEAAGVLVTSTWHETDATPQIESAMPDEQRAEVAERCLQEVDAADTFVWLHGGACGRIGAIVEYGYALGRGKDVYLVPLDGLEIGSVFGAISPVAAPGDVVRALAEVAP